MKKHFMWIVAVFLLSACTTKELYEHTQLQVKTHCNQKVGVEKEQCLENINEKTYDEYEKERQEIMKNKN